MLWSGALRLGVGAYGSHSPRMIHTTASHQYGIRSSKTVLASGPRTFPAPGALTVPLRVLPSAPDCEGSQEPQTEVVHLSHCQSHNIAATPPSPQPAGLTVEQVCGSDGIDSSPPQQLAWRRSPWPAVRGRLPDRLVELGVAPWQCNPLAG